MISAANAKSGVTMDNRQPNSTSIGAFAHAVVGEFDRLSLQLGRPREPVQAAHRSPRSATRSRRTGTLVEAREPMPCAVHGIPEVTALGAPSCAMDRACISSFQMPSAMNQGSRTLQIYHPRSHSRY